MFNSYWLVSHSRTLCVSLVLCNALLAVYLLAQPTPAVEPAIPALEPLRLVGEKRIALLSETGAVEPGPALTCRVWGPEPERDRLQAIATRLGGTLRDVQYFKRTIRSPAMYQVRLDQFQQITTARRVSDQLRTHGIDNFVSGGEQNPTIYAGRFSQESGAKRIRNTLAELGYWAEIEVVQKQYDAYHMRASLPVDSQAISSSNSPCLAFAQAQ